MKAYFASLTLALTLVLCSCGETTVTLTCEDLTCRPDQTCLEENPGFGITETACVTIGCDDETQCLEGEECVIPEQQALTQKLTLAPRDGTCKVPCETAEECDTECATDGYCAEPDCRTEGCPAGESCEGCPELEGTPFVCIPEGAVC